MMNVVRTTAWGILAAAVVAAGMPEPAAGQQPNLATTPTNRLDTPGGIYSAPGYPATMAPGVAGSAYRSDEERKQIAQLAQQYVKATKEDDKKDIHKKLSEALGLQFDQLAEQQQRELDDLEKQVAAMRTLLKKRHDARESIIDRRLDQVLQEAEGLGWGTHPAGLQPVYYRSQTR